MLLRNVAIKFRGSGAGRFGTLAELHDATAIAEILQSEHMGICEVCPVQCSVEWD